MHLCLLHCVIRANAIWVLDVLSDQTCFRYFLAVLMLIHSQLYSKSITKRSFFYNMWIIFISKWVSYYLMIVCAKDSCLCVHLKFSMDIFICNLLFCSYLHRCLYHHLLTYRQHYRCPYQSCNFKCWHRCEVVALTRSFMTIITKGLH